MQQSVLDPVFHTIVITIVFSLALLISTRLKASARFFSIETTQELKGFAILAIIFAHVGYYLVIDHRFLFPLSVLAGVGVDLFLFLSGYGLTASAIERPMASIEFYRKRLLKLFIPFWIVLAALFALDAIVLHHSYGFSYMLRSFLGIFSSANLYMDVNSPLWYFTLILGYYILFPITWWKRAPYLSAAAIYAFSLVVMHVEPSFLANVIPLYKTHLLAFPLGILAAYFTHLAKPIVIPHPYYVPVLSILAAAIGYFAIHSEVGSAYWLAGLGSICTMLLVLAFFVFKRFEIRLLTVFGVFSFEIYLFHWPLLYRYDIFFKYLPASVALVLYLGLFIALAFVLRFITDKINRFVY